MTQAAAYGTQAQSLAIAAAKQTGLSPMVILAQWYAENGGRALHASLWNGDTAPNNPGNVSALVGSLANELSLNPGQNTGFLSFATPQAGEQAYADTLTYPGAYPGILATAGKNPNIQMAAIAASNWDTTGSTAHYTNPGGSIGSELTSAYSVVTGTYANSIAANAGINSQTLSKSGLQYGPLIGKTLAKTLADWDTALRINPINVGNTLSGAILNDPRAIAFRGIFLLMGILLLAFAVLSFVSPKAKDIASIASDIAPIL